MKNIHQMTATTMVFAGAALSSMRAVKTFSPDDASPWERLHSAADKLLRRIWRMINDGVADAIARRERCVTQFALRNLSNIEMRDFGACRGNPGSVLHRIRDVKFTTRRRGRPQ